MSDQQPQQQTHDPNSWVKYMPAWLRVLIGTGAGLSLFFVFVPPGKIFQAVELLSSPSGIVLLYAGGVALTVFTVYKLVEGRVKSLAAEVVQCRAHHHACEARQKKLTLAMMDFIRGDNASAVAAIRKLLEE